MTTSSMQYRSFCSLYWRKSTIIICSWITPNEMVAFIAVISHSTTRQHFCRVCPQYQDLPSKSSLHGARIFLVLGSSYLSARKILVLGRSQHQGQVQPFACKLDSENIQCQDDPPSRIFLVLGSSSLHVNSPLYQSQKILLKGIMPKSLRAFHIQITNKLFLLGDAKIFMKDSVYKLKINTSI